MPGTSDNFNVKGVTAADKELFEQVRKERGFRYNHETLSHIFKGYKNAIDSQSSDQTSEIEALKAEILQLKSELETVNRELETANTSLELRGIDVDKIKLQLNGEFNEIYTQKDNQIAELSQKITELEQNSPQKIVPPSYIADPGIDRAKKIQRVIAYLIKQGKLTKNTNLLSDFTNHCIDYSIKNEFSHILK